MTAPLQAGMREKHTQIGAGTGLQYVSVCGYCQQCGDPWTFDAIQALDALGEAVRAERERCAKIAEPRKEIGYEIAAAIRAGTTEGT